MFCITEVIDFLKGMQSSNVHRLNNNIKAVTIEYDNGTKVVLGVNSETPNITEIKQEYN